MAANLSAELKAHLNARHLYPTSAWLQAFTGTTRANTPLAALKQTAVFRLLATDITKSLAQPQDTTFPRDILSGNSQCRYLAGPIICQVLDIEDIGHSRWSQVEAIEAQERGETTKGREIDSNRSRSRTLRVKGRLNSYCRTPKGSKCMDLIWLASLALIWS
jgi:RecQ-mediated genome instability protein 1